MNHRNMEQTASRTTHTKLTHCEWHSSLDSQYATDEGGSPEECLLLRHVNCSPAVRRCRSETSEHEQKQYVHRTVTRRSCVLPGIPRPAWSCSCGIISRPLSSRLQSMVQVQVRAEVLDWLKLELSELRHRVRVSTQCVARVER
ncbi:hypothetical protein K466DRAFT_15279 [Polyporus arcularius HHB13444]|uniref:Uncharacterized protein n=1 Tax=Polyporus arcularius HHB13444 TaxID=1314778 RepID=A0A5C3NSE7_9APHY|nr:hypothetical protein K466DRAFT_15279 [Polyporus arcularius HHB13444]